MKKTLISLLLTIGLVLPVAASATSCTDPGQSCGNGSPEMVTNVWGGTNSDVPHILPGQSRVNKFGKTNLCPAWFTNYCVDISETAYYTSRWGM